ASLPRVQVARPAAWPDDRKTPQNHVQTASLERRHNRELGRQTPGMRSAGRLLPALLCLACSSERGDGSLYTDGGSSGNELGETAEESNSNSNGDGDPGDGDPGDGDPGDGDGDPGGIKLDTL